MKLVFDEWYGTLSYAQRAAYRKHNVSPSDHDELVRMYGVDAHKIITDVVKKVAAEHGQFSTFYLRG